MNCKNESFRRAILGAAIGMVLLASTVPAAATTVGECYDLISLLNRTIGAADYTSNNPKNPDKDKEGLLRKVEQASIKLDRAKLIDSKQKLDEIGGKADELIMSEKIDLYGGQDIVDDATYAASCVQELIDQL